MDETAWTVGDVALSRICWSTDTPTSIEGSKRLVQGPWAGHRLAIVPKSAFNDFFPNSREGWTDVSEDVYGTLDEIWTTNNFPRHVPIPGKR